MTTVLDELLPDWRSLSPEAKLRLARTLEGRLTPDWYDTRARPEQMPPEWEWVTWLLMAGRGFGKTRTGAEWAWRQARAHGPNSRGALVGPTAGDTRDVLVEGESGILAVAPPDFRPKYEPSKRKLTYPNGAFQFTYSADEPDRLRGPQHHYAWVDEWAAMKQGKELMEMLELGLRLGDFPRKLVTTTPRPLPWLKDLMGKADTATTRGSTYENLDNLAENFKRAVLDKYEGTRLGRQELHAEILEDIEGALWQPSWIDGARADSVDEAVRIVVGVDPAVTATEESDETGIVVCSRVAGDPAHYQVLADYSGRYTPDAWAKTASDAADTWAADCIVAEVNNGGDLVGNTIRNVAPWARVKQVRASRGKATRAEPVAALYEQGRVHHVGQLPALEDQMTSFVPGLSPKSPDRMDALVWALTELAATYIAPPVKSFRT